MTTPTAREIARRISRIHPTSIYHDSEVEKAIAAGLAASHAAGMAEGIERAVVAVDNADNPSAEDGPWGRGFEAGRDASAAAIRALCPTPGA